MPRRKIHCLMFLLLVVGTAAGQVPYYHQRWLNTPGTPGLGHGFGKGLLVADFNQDGFDDLLCPESGAEPSVQWLFYGPTFFRRKAIVADSPAAFEGLGSRRGSVGDVNGDGHLDFLAAGPGWPSMGWPNVGRVRLFLGPTFATTLLFEDPTPELGGNFGQGNLLYDVDGDGRDDIFIGAPGYGLGKGDKSPGEIWYWNATDLATPTLLESPFGDLPGIGFGSLIRAGDLDGDGQDELIVRAQSYITITFQGAIGFSSLPSLKPLGTLLSRTFGASGFGFLADRPVADLTGDGLPDLIMGADNFSAFNSHPGACLVLAGPSFSENSIVLLPPLIPGTVHFGQDVFVADLDGDGYLDIGGNDAYHGFTGNGVRIWYGPDYDELQSLETTLGGGWGLGLWVAHGDFDADGYEEVVAYEQGGGDAGRVALWDARTLSADTQLASLAQGGTIQFSLDAGVAHAGQPYLAALGHSGTSPGIVKVQPHAFHAPLNPDNLTLLGLAALGSPLLEGFTGTLDATGHASFAFHMPPGLPYLHSGDVLVVAAAVFDERGVPVMGTSAAEILLGK